MIYTVMFGHPTNDDTKFDNETQRNCRSNLLAYPVWETIPSMGDAVVQFQADVFAHKQYKNFTP